MNHDETLVYSKSMQTVGFLGGVNYINEEVLLIDEDGKTHKLELNEDAILIHKIASDGEDALYDHDIFKSRTSDSLYEVELSNTGRLQFFAVDADLNRLEAVDTYAIDEFMRILKSRNSAFTLMDNRYALLADRQQETQNPEADDRSFNIKIIRKEDSAGDEHYYYACHNKAAGEVDILKVIYLGHHLLVEEAYQRITMPLEEFLEYRFESVTPDELFTHVLKERYGSDACDCSDGDACSDCPQETGETGESTMQQE